MPGWQRFGDAHPDPTFRLISVAVEHLGAEAARPHLEAAGATFATAVDEHGASGDRFGFKVVPNGLLVDEAGIVRYAKEGGFSVDHPEDVAAVERFVAGGDPGASPDPTAAYELGALERKLVATKVRLGRLLDERGRRADAVAEWRDALRLDPASFLIRKQIWAAEHPEKFHPEIDFAWQRAQLARERDEEIAAGVCGPDGCPIPGAVPRATP